MQEHIKPYQYRRHPVSGDGDCGYTSFGITRQHAYNLLSMNLYDIVTIIAPAVKSALLSTKFYNYLCEKKHITNLVSHDHICNHLDKYASDLNVATAYLTFDILDKNIDLGWAHPAILQALAKIRDIDIYMWRLNENEALIPHRIDDQDYAQLLTPGATDTVHLLFINNNHFERIEIMPNVDSIATPMDIEDDEPSDSPTMSYKSQLLLGEADFSYAFSLVKKHIQTHPEFGRTIIASCYESEASLKSSYSKAGEHIAYLLDQGVTVLFEVDARNIHKHPLLTGKKFDCIHFNFPHDKQHHSTNTLKNLISAFYQSAKQCQPLGGQIYMALPKPPNQLKYDSNTRTASNFFYKVLSYNIYDNSRNSGYRLVKKRMFNSERYPDYHHVQTGNSSAATVAERYPREYVFVNTTLSPEEILTLDKQRNIKPYHHQDKYIIPELITDNDTTDYFSSETISLKLFVIHDTNAAQAWIKELHTRMKQLLEKSEKKIAISSKAINKFKIQLQSLAAFLFGSPTKWYYTHTSGLNWKNSVTLWYYRSTVDNIGRLKLEVQNQNTFYQFLNLLASIIKQCSEKHDYLVMSALEALFYLNHYNIRSEKITEIAVQILANNDIDWHCKLVAAAILMQQHHHQQIESESVIATLFKQLGYDPRLDWILCKYLGEFELSSLILKKQNHQTLSNISDLRLIHYLLTNSDIRLLKKTKLKKLPNTFYREMAKFMHRKKLRSKPNQDDQLMEHAISTPQTLSIGFTRNLVTWEAEISHTSLCPNIFMPCESLIRKNQYTTIQAGLKDQHQLPSYLKLARHYELGINGCSQDNRKALNYYKLAAETGDKTALAKIMELFATGILDITHEAPEVWEDYCKKAQKLFSETRPEVNAYALIIRGILAMSQAESKKAAICFTSSLKISPQSPLANFYLAGLEISQQHHSEAQAILRTNYPHSSTFRNVLAKFIRLYSTKKLSPDVLANLLQFTREEEFSAIAACLSIILKILNEETLSRLCNQWILEIFPQHHYAKSLLGIQHTKNPYQVTFEICSSREDFNTQNTELFVRANSHHGIVAAFRENDLTNTFFYNGHAVEKITNEAILACVNKLLVCTNNEERKNLISQLNELITRIYEIRATYSKSLEVDQHETITILSEEEASNLSKKLEQDALQKNSPNIERRPFFEHPYSPLEEQPEPEDPDEITMNTENSLKF